MTDLRYYEEPRNLWERIIALPLFIKASFVAFGLGLMVMGGVAMAGPPKTSYSEAETVRKACQASLEKPGPIDPALRRWLEDCIRAMERVPGPEPTAPATTPR